MASHIFKITTFVKKLFTLDLASTHHEKYETLYSCKGQHGAKQPIQSEKF